MRFWRGSRARAGVTFVALSTTVALTGITPGHATLTGPPVTQPTCSEGLARVTTFNGLGAPVADWRENLAFDRLDGLWVTAPGRVGSGRLERYDASGAVTTAMSLAGASGIVRGPDGMLYLAAELPAHPGVSVARFDPADETPELEAYASGLPGANGMAFDRRGNLYVDEGMEAGIVKLRPGGAVDAEWTEATSGIWGANGLAVAREAIFANVTFDQRSPIERVPLKDPGAHTTLAQLSFGAISLQPEVVPGDPRAPLAPKGLDDLVAARGVLYTTAFLTGELLRVDQETGEACVAARGLATPTSVRFAEAFGVFDRRRDLFVTEASGNIRRVRLPG